VFEVEEGTNFEKDFLVGIIDTTDLILKRIQLKAQINAIASRIESTRSQIEVHEQQKKNFMVDKERISKLFNDGAATQKQVDDINGAIDLTDSQINSVKTQFASIISEQDVVLAQIAQVEESISRCHIFNPVKGTVLEKYAESNEITAFGKPLYKIADLQEMILRVYVSGAQLIHIKVGQEVEVLVDENAEENRQLTGKISWVSETAEFTPKIIQTKEERVNMVYAVKIRVKNDGSLKLGMPGEVNFKNTSE